MSVWILLLTFFICSVPSLAENYVLRSNLTSKKCFVNTTVAFWCNVNSMISGSEDAIWYRQVGESKQVLGLSTMLSVEFDGGRYKISLLKKTQTAVIYELIISSAKFQDSATIQCASPTSKQISSANTLSFAVCSNLNSSFCNCIVAEGWASPHCNKVVETAKAKRYESRRGCIGIGVCLAFVLGVALILTILLIINEVKSRNERKSDLKSQKIEIEKKNQMKLDQPSGPSILKKTQTNQEGNGLQIDPFSMTQLQQIPAVTFVRSDQGYRHQNNNVNNANVPRHLASSNPWNVQAVPRTGDVKYSNNFHGQGRQDSSNDSESQI